MFDALKAELAGTGTVQFYVRARPGMPETKAVLVMDDESVKIDVAAAAEGGRANATLLRYLATEFGTKNVAIVAGKTARVKLVRITR